MQHHRNTCGRQRQSQQGQHRGGAAAAVIGNPKAQSAAPGSGQDWTQAAISIQHAAELLGRWPTNAVGNQKSPHLGRVNLAFEHQLDRCTGFLATEAGAGVFAAAHLADQFSEQGAIRTQGIKTLLAASFKRRHGGIRRWIL